MSVHFYPLQVRDVRPETAEAVSVSFEVPPALASKFSFVQGQYLTLRAHIDGQEVRRSYSICTAPHEGDLRVAIKQVPGGVFSTYANRHLKVGDVLEVMPPMGSFHTPLRADQHRTYVAFAAGSGITPVMSILKAVLHQEPQSHFVLFYANRNTDSIIFREQLEALKNLHLQRLSIFHVLSREAQGSPLLYGRLNTDKCHTICTHLVPPSQVAAYFLCGPFDMVTTISEALQAHGVERARIYTELFGAPTITPTAAATTTTAQERVDSLLTVVVDGFEYEFPLSSDGETVLDAALRHGADLPFACKGGVCCTCKAKVLEGEVHMNINYGLEPDEVAAGYVLTCQAHPRSQRVHITFDEK